MAVTVSMVKELRGNTGAGMMDCKNALVEADGDIETIVPYTYDHLLFHINSRNTKDKHYFRKLTQYFYMSDYPFCIGHIDQNFPATQNFS